MQRKSKANNRVSEIFLPLIALLPIGYEGLSSFIYHYNNYIQYSLLGIIIGLSFFYFLPRVLKSIEGTGLYYFLITIIIIHLNIWFIPKLLHFFYIETDLICVKAKYINWSHTGRRADKLVNINIQMKNNDILKNPISLKKISNIPLDEHMQMAPVGSDIQICGDNSKIGFDYSYIEAKELSIENAL